MEELNAIYERMRAIFAEEAGFVPNDGCDAMVRLYALASEVQSLLAQADWVLDQSFPQTAVGQYLDYHAETRALARLPAAKATGVLRFSAPSAAVTDYEIEQGSVAMTSGGVRFETTEKATLSKLLLLLESAIVLYTTYQGFGIAKLAIELGFMGTLPWIATMVTAAWGAYGTSAACYYAKAKAENTAGGVTYETVCRGQDCEG